MSVVTLIDFRENPDISLHEIYKNALLFFPEKIRRQKMDWNVRGELERIKRMEDVINYEDREILAVPLNKVLRLGWNYTQPWILALNEPIYRKQITIYDGKIICKIDLLSGHTLGNRSVISEFSLSTDDLVKILTHEFGHQIGLFDHEGEEFEECFMSTSSPEKQFRFCKICLENLLRT
ncbi:MAG: hypothetical protein OH319_02090 [Candidatus Parvarchaeota archaeon]|nr:hypothetical protein [Candidatus Jingweiarchaeum tengchongense]MCW1298159.1 hypothetical protein [Candidatus Jingweiarchaeum tengchongense]MCW1299957.1 hypothetical protein [Candidatus Jingweiarchaeum tengchongense]MCW1305058.1 hypothetical protein [Candidatus Jingweiarchaeum tengchongense]MCW1305579.1 hypothetical protein [Candidatus Jingweiarchaeum tengchongense]